VRRHSVADVVHSTMGEGNPSHLTAVKPYHYRGRPGWPFDPETRDDPGGVDKAKGGALARQADRQRRLAEFTVARVRDRLDVIPAGERVGVTRKTAQRYEKDRLAQLGEHPDAQ
jgi:hypothetical protein